MKNPLNPFSMSSKNLDHPECRQGERFYTNVVPEKFSTIDNDTKRMGNVAYDINGKTVKWLRPVFVKKD